jgi:Shedu protein SduA, C-terminal
MKTLEPFRIDFQRCRREVTALRRWLARNPILEEKEQILPFFRAHRHLAALVGSYGQVVHRCDRIAFEYPLFGDYCCDLVVGDFSRQAYCFIEFEDAGPTSLFIKRGPKATREWSPRFERGFSQIVDWFHKLDDMRRSDDLVTRFGSRTIMFSGVLVVGRDHHLDAGERERLVWRRYNVVVSSRRIDCVTFDELVDHLHARLEAFVNPKT